MLIKASGLVLKSRNIGEEDCILTILTKELGLIEVTANRPRRTKSQLSGATQLLVYAEFCIYQGKRYSSINSAESINTFYDLRLDVEKMALAVYLCDLTAYLLPLGEKNTWPFLRLLLNTFALLQADKRPLLQLKALCELRVLSLSGFMPNIVACNRCGCYEHEEMYFLPVSASLCCADCKTQPMLADPIPLAVLRAMRHIVYADDDKVFQFRLAQKSLLQLCYIIEHYLLLQTEKEFPSLSVFWQLYQLPIESSLNVETEKT